jgi:hypothetical protein
MFPFQPTNHDAFYRMTNLVRQIGEEQEREQFLNRQAMTNPTQKDAVEDKSIVDLSFYQINENAPEEYEEGQIENTSFPILDRFASHANQCTSLNLSYNYLIDPYLFLNAKYEDLLLPQLINIKEFNLSHNDFNQMSLNKLTVMSKSLINLNISYNRLKFFALPNEEEEDDEKKDEVIVFDRLNVLNLSNNQQLAALNRNFVQMFPNIVELDLSNGSLTTEAIQCLFVAPFSMVKLRVLKLNKNRLIGEDFPAKDASEFVSLPNLEEMYLDENEITSLNDTWLHKSSMGTNLRVLSLSHNKLNKLNDVLFNENIFGKLNKLLVEDNAIESLPMIVKHECSEQSSQMEELRLNDNRIVEIKPGELFTKWSQLKRITLQKNKLQQLPDDIGNLKHIEELYLFGNELTHLPKGIGDLVQLKELDLYNNRLESLPEEIGNLVELQRLTLEDNQLKAVPNSIANLVKLQVFSTRGNKDLKMSPLLVMLQTDK